MEVVHVISCLHVKLRTNHATVLKRELAFASEAAWFDKGAGCGGSVDAATEDKMLVLIFKSLNSFSSGH